MPDLAPHVPSAPLRLVSNFGLPAKMLGGEFPALSILRSERVQNLEYRARYYQCRQHDWKVFDWNGSMRRPATFPTQPLIGTTVPDFFVPFNIRRPASPYRLSRTIVSAFTTLTFGHGRWPSIISDDPETQDFARELVKECKLKTKMIRARNLGGSAGSVGLSWGFVDGKPRVRVHPARTIWIAEWEDEDELIPAHVVEIYQYPRDVADPKTGKLTRQFFWHRRDWTQNADVQFVPTPVTDRDPQLWRIDEEKSVQHNDGLCHFVWVQNLPNDDEDNSSIDGTNDYPALYEQLDNIDELNSAVAHGTKRNLDPTLVIKMHKEELGESVIRKGSDNALAVGPNGAANYLELAGTAVTAGTAAINLNREQVLETCQCVVPDPNEVVGSATSSVALRIVYAPMLSKGDVMRDQYGEAILRLLNAMIAVARKNGIGTTVEEVQVVVDEEGNEIESSTSFVVPTLNLPPRIEKEEILDDQGQGTGEFTLSEHPRVPGNGTLSLEWPDYFKDTAGDRQQMTTALSQAVGARPIMSQQTGAEILATSLQRDPQVEWSRLTKEEEERRALESAMFPGTGGQVDNIDDLPEGAAPDERSDAPTPETTDPSTTSDLQAPTDLSTVPVGEPEKVVLAPTQVAAVITVDEYRKQSGLPAWPVPAEGALPVKAFEALMEARVQQLIQKAGMPSELPTPDNGSTGPTPNSEGQPQPGDQPDPDKGPTSDA